MDELFKLYYFRLDVRLDAAVELAEIVSEYKCRVMERAIKLGVDAVVCGDGYVNDGGPLTSPRLFDEFILPYIKRAMSAVHSLGGFYIKHTDGNLGFILERLVVSGIDALHPIESAAGMDIAKLKRMYGGRICLIGNVDCRWLLTEGTIEEVVEVVKETMAKAAPNGGYILSSSNSIHPGVKPENFVAMVDAAKRYGRYPIDESLIEEYSARNFHSKLFPRLSSN